jgi:5-formyltetrahydrofolate cyclo-ligase
VRAQVRGRLDGFGGPELQEKSRRIAQNLFATGWWQEAQWVFAYIAMPVEVDTRDIIVRAYTDEKRVAIPRMEGEQIVFYRYHGRTQELLPNQFGILEPDPEWVAVDPCALPKDPTGTRPGRSLLILAPGMAFDGACRRLGRGKGYYDRLLSSVRACRIGYSVVGLAFAEQLVAEVPVQAHDQPLDGVVTDREVFG